MTRREADLTNIDEVRAHLLAIRPNILIHAAAIADPDLCEREPERAFQNNVIATRNIVAVAKQLDLPVAYISTDAVFDGLSASPRTELDAANPISTYGKTKLLGEHAVSELNRHWIFRVSVLFGPGKENFISKGLRLLKRGEVYPVAADQTGTATYTPDAAAKILEVTTSGHFGLFHLCNAGACSRWELARQAAFLAGLPLENVIGKPLAAMGRIGPRPRYAVMENRALKAAGIPPLRPWRIALAEYVTGLKGILDPLDVELWRGKEAGP